MTNFTLNNHLSYTIGNRSFGYRETPIEKYQVNIGSVDHNQYNTGSYESEMRRIADSVYKELGKDLILFISGGTDSEIVLRSFLSIGVKPHCVMLKFKNDYNIDDVSEGTALANELGIPLEVVDFDVQDFYYSGEATEFGNQIQCTQITYIMIYNAVKKFSAPSVMGGEVLLTRQVSRNDSFWYYTLRENEDASAMRFSNKFNIPLVNEWFSYTPEALLHYLEHPDIKSLVTDLHNYKLSSVSSKNNILKKLYPTIRQKKKTHGFESLLGFNYEVYKDIGSHQVKRLESSLDGIPYNEVINQLRGIK